MGYWFREPPPVGSDGLSGPVAEFLADGPAPVYVGFGSMPTPDPTGVVRGVVDVLSSLELRGVVSEGLSGLTLDGLPVEPAGRVLAVGSTPHDLLFPRCSVIVHHGGAGTTAAAVLGASDGRSRGGATADRRKDLTPARLRVALEVALSVEARRAAYALGEQVRAEDGAGDAARLVDAYLSRARPSSPGTRARPPPAGGRPPRAARAW